MAEWTDDYTERQAWEAARDQRNGYAQHIADKAVQGILPDAAQSAQYRELEVAEQRTWTDYEHTWMPPTRAETIHESQQADSE